MNSAEFFAPFFSPYLFLAELRAGQSVKCREIVSPYRTHLLEVPLHLSHILSGKSDKSDCGKEKGRTLTSAPLRSKNMEKCICQQFRYISRDLMSELMV